MKVLFALLIILVACSSNEPERGEQPVDIDKDEDMTLPDSSDFTNYLFAHDTVITMKFRDLDFQTHIFFPETDSIAGQVVLLHGWNLPEMEWCEKTELCARLKEEGYVLIIPNFTKTTYHFEVYPETREDYLAHPTRKWMYETWISNLQELGFLLENKQTTVIGLSTGGRGAALFGLEHPEVFNAAVCLSADFDQTKIVDEPINNGYYGSYAENPERWEGKDNIYNRADEIEIPFFVAHGKEDKMCPSSQSELFYNRLLEINAELNHVGMIVDGADHNYEFWGSQTEPIIKWMMENKKK